MTKACSLDFLNKTEFDTDVLLADGRILYSNGDPITPEVILKLYFKDIYIPKKLEFDEGHAERVRDYSFKMGRLLHFSKEQLDDLMKAAYHHDIGRTKFAESDLQKHDFARWQGEAGVNILVNEMHFLKEVAEVASLHLKPYNSARFHLTKDSNKNIPFAHIVAIANRYDELRRNKYSKREALRKLIQIGGDRFNIFILHKFVRAMRDENA